MLAILSTHPIQYQAPLWQALAADGRIPFEVWYVTDHGVQVTLDREFGRSFAWDIQTLDGYPHRFLEAAPGATPSSFWKCRVAEDLALRLKASGAKALWIQGWQVAAYWQAALSAERAGAELWLRGESNDLPQPSPAKRFVKRIVLGELFRRVDHFLFIGKANKRLYEKYGVQPHQLHPAHYAVDNQRFARQAAELAPLRHEIRERWAIPADAFCVLFCGKFIEKKRPLDLVAAAHALHQSGAIPKLHLLFVGSGDLGPAIRDRCAVRFDAEPAGAVEAQDGAWRPSATFTGFLNQTQISQAYVAADCLVLPSDSRETWGLVVNEALASGLPCAASLECGCAEDLLSHHTPARTFKVGDHEGIANAVASIYHDAPAVGASRAQLFGHTVDATINEIVNLYETSFADAQSQERHE